MEEKEPLKNKTLTLELKGIDKPDELLGEYYHHVDLYNAFTGINDELDEWFDKAEAEMFRDLLEKWFPDIQEYI